MIIGIIGAGASGMAAALAASQQPGVEVLLFERQARVGRKLQATGNGRCNLTNLQPAAYHGDNAEFAAPALANYPPSETLQWFSNLGLYTVVEDSGRVYPYSDQANSVVDVLRFALQKENIRLLTAVEVTKVRKDGKAFEIISDGEAYRCDKLIIACGGLAGTKLGGSMSGYKLLRSFGHHCTRLRPALVQIKSGWNGCVSLKGVRANCHVEIYNGDMRHSASNGELQFTDYGLSGPVIFETSRDVCQQPGNWFCRLDFLPDISRQMLLELLMRKRSGEQPAEELLTGILHNRLGRVLTASAGIRGQRSCQSLTDAELEQVIDAVKSLEVDLTEPLGMDSAQVTAGGIVTDEFNPETMESRLVPGLYACGEVLDIDGDCGGYNLQWAWSSGRLAGSSAGGNT
ncbi:MAG: aminoacetone oxidase family FAD-binding enzyme [Ruminococcaceae bacterium]|nr:aminoacetone oxidase family FAD-binding enzyme [Oscillospiraceae bacterium]